MGARWGCGGDESSGGCAGAVVRFGEGAEARGGLLGGEVALRFREEFKADHEFADGGGAEKRRVKVHVEVGFRMGEAVGGGLVDAH
mmetsp:Transcript_33227/g.81522  ORF Transcript_33227/g.81522 Transcript_33227/m.81522 type:complete len:86 (+) Transcript_33227:480-737(+)